MDWIAGILELLGKWLVGDRKRIGFAASLLSCFVWGAVAIRTEIYGLLLVVIPAMVINVRNFLKWGRNGGGQNGHIQRPCLQNNS